MNFYLKLFLFYVITLNTVEIRSCSGSELGEPQRKQEISAALQENLNAEIHLTGPQDSHNTHPSKRIEKAWNMIIELREKALKAPHKGYYWELTPENAKILHATNACLRTIATKFTHPLHATKAWEAIKILSNCSLAESIHTFSYWENIKVALVIGKI